MDIPMDQCSCGIVLNVKRFSSFRCGLLHMDPGCRNQLRRDSAFSYRIRGQNFAKKRTQIRSYNLSDGVALIMWFITNGMCVKNKTIIYVSRASNRKRDCDVVALPILTCEWLNVTTSVHKERLRALSLLLLAATVRSFVHMPLGIFDRNKMVLWPGCGGRAKFSLHTKNVWSVWFVVKRRGCCCNLSGGVALIMWFTTNGMCVKNKTIIYVARASTRKRDCDMISLPILTCERLNVTTSVRKERLRALSLVLLAATVRSFVHMPLGISDRNSVWWSCIVTSCLSAEDWTSSKKVVLERFDTVEHGWARERCRSSECS